MAVLGGIINGQEAGIKRLYHAVAHRGPAYQQQLVWRGHHFVTARIVHDHIVSHSSGSYQAEYLWMGVAGTVTDLEQNHLTPSDLAERYQQQGLEAFLAGIQGAYVLAIATPECLHVVRDATGQRTIYYHQEGQRFAFCIESKGIQALPHFSPQLNVKAVFQYFSYSFIPLGETMMAGIYELPAGCCVTFRFKDHSVRVHRYFQLETFDKHHLEDFEYWKARIRTALQTEIQTKLRGQEDVGIFLSGGLDSSIITAQVAQQHQHPVHTFSIHFGRDYPNELEYAAAVAQRYQTTHHEVEVRPKQFVHKLRDIIWRLDEPIGDPITIPNFELAQYASQHVGVIFNGEGSDPCFGGPKNIPMLLGHWYGGIERPPNFREKAYLDSYRRGYQHLRELLSPALLDQLDEASHLESILTPFFETPQLNFLDKLMSINIRLKGAHLILPKVERMLAAASLSAVAPFFTREVVQASMEMPSTFKLHQGIEKYILKEIFAEELPHIIIDRPKSGMRVPVRYWFQKELKRYKKQLLRPKAIRQGGIFNPDTIQLLLKYSPQQGLKRHGLLTWMVMTFELWRQIFIEKQY